MFPGWKRGCSIVEIHLFSFDTACTMDFCLNLNRNLIVICLLGMFEVDCGTKSPSTNIIVTIDKRIYSLCRFFIVSVLLRTYDFHIFTCWISNLVRPLRIERLILITYIFENHFYIKMMRDNNPRKTIH